MARCKQGDLAIVIREFEGCEGNLGKLVRVIGYPRRTKYWGLLWEIKPLAASGWWFCPCSDNAITGPAKYSKGRRHLEHMDDWLFPIRGDLALTATTKKTRKPSIKKKLRDALRMAERAGVP